MDVKGDRAIVSVVGATLQELVGSDGEVLEALQELTRLAVHQQTGMRARLMLDISGYRARRRAELADYGRTVAEEVARTGEPKSLAAMSPFERKLSTMRWPPPGCGASPRVRSPTGGSWSSPPGDGQDLPAVSAAPDDTVPGSTPELLPGPAPEPVPGQAASVFGTALPVAVAYAGILATRGVEQGLLGPHELPRLWDRHLLNCAVVAELIDERYKTMLDLGSGAGLPGLVLAMLRPDMEVTLLDPMERRCRFLTECVTELDLANVSVLRGRAEDVTVRTEVVTARAVAPLSRLAALAMGTVSPGGMVLAIKGRTAAEELKAADASCAGLVPATPRLCGPGTVRSILRLPSYGSSLR